VRLGHFATICTYDDYKTLLDKAVSTKVKVQYLSMKEMCRRNSC